MKKLTVYTLAVIITFTACSKMDLQQEEPETPSTPTEWKVSINASKGNDTKALSESGTTITASWEAGDVVYICNNNYNYGTLIAQSSGSSTLLVGTITKSMTVGNTYTLRYLQKGDNYLYLPNQVGTLADIAHNHDMAEATVTVKSVSGSNVEFNETSVNFESKICITKFTFNRNITNVTIFCSNLKTYVRPGYSSNYGFIDVVPAAATPTVYVAMSALEAKSAIYLFLAKDEDGLYYTSAMRAQIANGKNYTANVTLSALPQYVDLGIRRDEVPVYWATKNLGATHPADIGNYYAWGETTTKTTYSWDNYAWGKYSAVTKYDPDRPDQGTVDGRAFLLPEDDAATAALGDGWRMPNYNDFNDLLNKTNIENIRAYADGRWGYCFHSLIDGFTNKFIFIPMTGGYYNGSSRESTGYGYYWSNKIDQISWTSASFANTMQMESYYSEPEISRMQRAYGLAVRPVYITPTP